MYVIWNNYHTMYLSGKEKGILTFDIKKARKFEFRESAESCIHFNMNNQDEWKVIEIEEDKMKKPLLKLEDEEYVKECWRNRVYSEKDSIPASMTPNTLWRLLVEAGIAEKAEKPLQPGLYWVKWFETSDWTVAEKGVHFWYPIHNSVQGVDTPAVIGKPAVPPKD